MNKQTPIDSLVQSLTSALTKSQSTSKRSPRRKKRVQSRTTLSRNPGTRSSPDNMLALTRDQFTATSPLNLFTVSKGSTPGGIRVRGRELLSAVSFTGALTGAFALSNNFNGQLPGSVSGLNPSSFPRLTAYNPIYEYFVFHKIDYLFQSNQPTTQGGEIILSIDYDPTDSAPASTSAMMRNISSTMSNVYSDCSLQGIKSLSRLPKYETSSNVTEQLQSLQGNLFVAAEGVTAAAGATLGYIIAQYDVELFTPQ